MRSLIVLLILSSIAICMQSCSSRKTQSNLHHPATKKNSLEKQIKLLEAGTTSSSCWFLSELIDNISTHAITTTINKKTLLNKKQTIDSVTILKQDITTRLSLYKQQQDYASFALSFLCLVLNAHDATMHNKTQQNKTGVGFFSAMRFLLFEETGGCTMFVTSRYTLNQKKYLEFTMVLRPAEHPILNAPDVAVTIQDISPLTSLTPSGTLIRITPNNQQTLFCEELRDELATYIHNGYRFHDVAIVIKTLEGQTIIGDTAEQPRIIVSLLPTELSIQDFGCGMSITKALTQLIIPGASSTKKLTTE